MQIKIICFGKLDKKFFIEPFKEYQTRLSNYCNFEVIELKETFQKELLTNINFNCEQLSKKIALYKDYEIICFDVNGQQATSESFAKIIADNKNIKQAKLLFVIGPSDGYNKTFLANKYLKISFGKITFPHQLFRIIVAEQIYRSFKIISNEKYHK